MGNRPREAVLAEIRERASLIPGTNVNIGQPISHRIDHMLSGTQSNLAVKIFGNDLGTLRALAEQVEQAMSEVNGVVDLAAERQADVPTVRVRFRRDDLARYGLPAGTAAEALKAAFLGVEVGSVREGQVAFPLVLRYESSGPKDIEAIRQAMVDTPSGPRIPFSAIADIREDRSPNVITRENIQRKIVVSCNVAGRDLRGVVTDIQERVADAVDFPQGYWVEYGGQYESEERAMRRIVLASVLVIVGIGVLLSTAFRSARDALVVMLNLPLALVPLWRHPIRGFSDRVHHPVRCRDAQRDHSHLSHQARGGGGWLGRNPPRDHPRRFRTSPADPDDGDVNRACSGSCRARIGDNRQRVPRTPCSRCTLRPRDRNRPQHDCRASSVHAVRPAG